MGGYLPTERLGEYRYSPRSRRHDFPDAKIAFFIRILFVLNFYWTFYLGPVKFRGLPSWLWPCIHCTDIWFFFYSTSNRYVIVIAQKNMFLISFSKISQKELGLKKFAFKKWSKIHYTVCLYYHDNFQKVNIREIKF